MWDELDRQERELKIEQKHLSDIWLKVCEKHKKNEDNLALMTGMTSYSDADVFFTQSAVWALLPLFLVLACTGTWVLLDRAKCRGGVERVWAKVRASCVALLYLLYPVHGTANLGVSAVPLVYLLYRRCTAAVPAVPLLYHCTCCTV